MKNQFDNYVDRNGTNSAKWNRYADQDVIPAWVADMDFPSPEPIVEALTERVAHGVFGYSRPPRELIQRVVDRMLDRYNWQVEPDWLVWLPGVVPGLCLSCASVGERGDAVMTPTPVYYPFLKAPATADRGKIDLPVRKVSGFWEFDFDLMRKLVTDRTRVFLLCNPYNPVGRILTKGELESIAEICLENNILICSDEIHSDLLLDKDKPHIPTAMLGKDVANNTITLISPSKTFNLAGLGGCAVAIIPNRQLRSSFRKQAMGLVPGVGVLAYEAALIAYRGDCDEWHEQLLDYLRANRDYLQQEIDGIPGLAITHVEATYLAWIDTGKLNVSNAHELFLTHGVGLSEGDQFGDADYVRLNFGCPRSTLEEIVRRMKSAIVEPGRIHK
jgi:cystathionine beta-lyase